MESLFYHSATEMGWMLLHFVFSYVMKIRGFTDRCEAGNGISQCQLGPPTISKLTCHAQSVSCPAISPSPAAEKSPTSQVQVQQMRLKSVKSESCTECVYELWYVLVFTDIS